MKRAKIKPYFREKVVRKRFCHSMENFSRTLLAQRVSTEKILWEYHLKVNSLAFLVKLVQLLQISLWTKCQVNLFFCLWSVGLTSTKWIIWFCLMSWDLLLCQTFSLHWVFSYVNLEIKLQHGSCECELRNSRVLKWSLFCKWLL